MSPKSPAPRFVTIPKKNFKDGSAKGFESQVRGKIFQGLVVKKAGKFYAYHNLCMHLPVTLDLGDGDFFTHDREFLQCHTHGAMYELDTGLCVGGPCVGARLNSLELVEEDDQIVIRIPEDLSK